ncbi:VOC family protein [Nocardioides pacificus]
MALATFKDLCIDAVDPVALGDFWAGALGRERERRKDGMVLLTGPTPRHTIWVNAVPEPVSVKQRVHLDVHARSVDDVLALGATALDLESFRWKVLADPEGGELCVFEREEVPTERLYEIVVDSVDPVAQARWWATLLGASQGHDAEHGWAWVEDIPGAPFESLVFVSVPEPKAVKNRIHLDVDTADLAALTAGSQDWQAARVLRAQDDEIGWTVLADPEGNEFCAFQS